MGRRQRQRQKQRQRQRQIHRQKISARLGVLQLMRPFVSEGVAKLVFNAMVLPLFDYADTVWANSYAVHLDRIQKLQNRAARIILKCKIRDVHVTDMLHKLGWKTCAQRYAMHRAVLVFKCVNGLAPTYLSGAFNQVGSLHTHSTRQAAQGQLALPKVFTDSGKRCFTYTGAVTFNSLPFKIRSAESLNIFKQRLSHFM
jgi:hypothetical protein